MSDICRYLSQLIIYDAAGNKTVTSRAKNYYVVFEKNVKNAIKKHNILFRKKTKKETELSNTSRK